MNNDLLNNLIALTKDSQYIISVLSNSASLIFHSLDNLNWAGFYLFLDNQLVLGPFQGKVACQLIQLDKGVCGKCASSLQVQLVNNVHEFEGHIACDPNSNSEIVLPIIIDNKLFGLLDIDSPILNRFTKHDEEILREVVNYLEKKIKELS